MGTSHGFGVFNALGVQSDSDSSAMSNKMSGQSSAKPNRPSLAKILLSLDGNLAKQQALSHVLSALQIMYARYVFLRQRQPSYTVTIIIYSASGEQKNRV